MRINPKIPFVNEIYVDSDDHFIQRFSLRYGVKRVAMVTKPFDTVGDARAFVEGENGFPVAKRAHGVWVWDDGEPVERDHEWT